MMEISERQLQMILPEGFDRIFSESLSDFKTQEECYNALEEEYQKAFGRRRYANFESFRVARARRLRKQLRNPVTVRKAV